MKSEYDAARDTHHRLRLDCLKLAYDRLSECVSDCSDVSDKDQFDLAEKIFDFATDKPKRPNLFAVRRIGDCEEIERYLVIMGTIATFGSVRMAYRFRSSDEALYAIHKHGLTLGHLLGPVPLTDEYDLF